MHQYQSTVGIPLSVDCCAVMKALPNNAIEQAAGTPDLPNSVPRFVTAAAHCGARKWTGIRAITLPLPPAADPQRVMRLSGPRRSSVQARDVRTNGRGDRRQPLSNACASRCSQANVLRVAIIGPVPW